MSDGVPISVAADTKSESELIERSREVRWGIDEERRVVDLLFVAGFA